MRTKIRLRALRVAAIVLAPIALSACRQDMHDNPRYEPLEASRVHADGASARPLVEGTVPRGFLRDDELLYTGLTDEGLPAEEFPFAVTRAVLDRGEDRYNIFCAPCHSKVGDGRGMVVQRGYRQPPTFHDDRLRAVPPGYVFDVITNGFGVMPDYRSQIDVRDRWAIVAYVKALQLSQQATEADVPAEERGRLNAPAAGGDHAAPANPETGGH